MGMQRPHAPHNCNVSSPGTLAGFRRSINNVITDMARRDVACRLSRADKRRFFILFPHCLMLSAELGC